MTYGDRGIGVSCLCPMAVATAMLGMPADADEASDVPRDLDAAAGAAAVQGILPASAVADAAVIGLREGRFLILPHPEVATFEQRRASDHDRWLAGMRRLNTALGGRASPGGSRRLVTVRPDPPVDDTRAADRARRPRPRGRRPGEVARPTGSALARRAGRRTRAGRQRRGARRARCQPGPAPRAPRGRHPGATGRGDLGTGGRARRPHRAARPVGPDAERSRGASAVTAARSVGPTSLRVT